MYIATFIWRLVMKSQPTICIDNKVIYKTRKSGRLKLQFQLQTNEYAKKRTEEPRMLASPLL